MTNGGSKPPLCFDDLLEFADVDGSGEVGAADYLLAYATLYEKEMGKYFSKQRISLH